MITDRSVRSTVLITSTGSADLKCGHGKNVLKAIKINNVTTPERESGDLTYTASNIPLDNTVPRLIIIRRNAHRIIGGM